MKFTDIFRWVTTAVAATAIPALTPFAALAVYGAPGAGDASLPVAAYPQVDRTDRVSHARGIDLASEDEINSDDTGQPPDIDDQGTDSPPDMEDDHDGGNDYAGVNGGIVYGPGWYGPGWWYAPAWWFSPGVVWFGGFGHFGRPGHFRNHDRFGFRGRFDGHDRFRDHGRFGGRGRFGMRGGFRGGMGWRR